MTHFRAWTHTPSIMEYVVPPEPKSLKKRTPTTLNSATTADLQVKLDEWNAAINSFEEETAANPVTLKDRLASLMFSKDVAGQVKKQEMQWDPKGDGTITKGEFRMHMRGIGIRAKAIDNSAIDELFDEWDVDGSASLDMDELAQALAALKQEWTEQEGKTGLARLKRQQALDQLKMRVEAANDALVTHDAAEVCATELESIKADIADRLDIQLGGLLAKRAIKVCMPLWPGVRTSGECDGGALSSLCT